MCGKYRQTCTAASSLVCKPQSMADAKTGRGKGDGVRSRGKREDTGLVSISTRSKSFESSQRKQKCKLSTFPSNG